MDDNNKAWKEVTYLNDKEKRDIALSKVFMVQVIDMNSKYFRDLGGDWVCQSRSTKARFIHPTNP